MLGQPQPEFPQLSLQPLPSLSFEHLSLAQQHFLVDFFSLSFLQQEFSDFSTFEPHAKAICGAVKHPSVRTKSTM